MICTHQKTKTCENKILTVNMKVADFQMWDKILPDDQLLKVLLTSQTMLSLSEKKKNCYCSGDGL